MQEPVHRVGVQTEARHGGSCWVVRNCGQVQGGERINAHPTLAPTGAKGGQGGEG